MIEAIHGEGTIVSKIPAMFKMFQKYDIDMRKEPILIYPTLHYQNGGVEIDENCRVANCANLYAAGEVVGGIHGRNRLMGNSLLDIIVFGREAGRQAAARAKEIERVGRLNLDHVAAFEKELEDAWVDTGVVSPKLFPSYKANFRTYLNTSFSTDKTHGD